MAIDVLSNLQHHLNQLNFIGHHLNQSIKIDIRINSSRLQRVLWCQNQLKHQNNFTFTTTFNPHKPPFPPTKIKVSTYFTYFRLKVSLAGAASGSSFTLTVDPPAIVSSMFNVSPVTLMDC